MKKCIFYILSILLLFSCKKEDDQPSFPLILVSTNFKVVSDVRLFAVDGEIKDVSKIIAYLDRCDSSVFSFNKDFSIAINDRDTLIYFSSDTLIFSKLWPESSNKLDRRGQRKKDGYLYFYNNDTTYLIKSKSINGSTNDDIDNIVFNLGIFKPNYVTEDLPDTYGYSYMVKYLSAYIAKGSYYKLEFPYISFRLTRGTMGFPGIFLSRTEQLYNNKFDQNVINLLKKGDTLAIQETKLIYENIQ